MRIPPLLVSLFLLTPTLPHHQGKGKDTWGIQIDDPNKSGTVAVQVDIEYLDDKGKEHKFSLTTDKLKVSSDMDAEAKKLAIEAAITKAAAAATGIPGGPLVVTGGPNTGNLLTIKPVADNRAAAIKDLKVIDRTTNEKDLIIKPGPKVADADSTAATTALLGRAPASPGGLASLEITGTITGFDAEPAHRQSEIGVTTSLGADVVLLTPGMTQLDALRGLSARLGKRGIVTWVDHGAPRLYVLVNERFIGIGAGSSDAGIETTLTVITD